MSQILQGHVGCGEDLAFMKRDTKPSQACDFPCPLLIHLPSLVLHSSQCSFYHHSPLPRIDLLMCAYEYVRTLLILGDRKPQKIFDSQIHGLQAWLDLVAQFLLSEIYLSSHLLCFLLCCFILRQAPPRWWLR